MTSRARPRATATCKRCHSAPAQVSEHGGGRDVCSSCLHDDECRGVMQVFNAVQRAQVREQHGNPRTSAQRKGGD